MGDIPVQDETIEVPPLVWVLTCLLLQLVPLWRQVYGVGYPGVHHTDHDGRQHQANRVDDVDQLQKDGQRRHKQVFTYGENKIKHDQHLAAEKCGDHQESVETDHQEILDIARR